MQVMDVTVFCLLLSCLPHGTQCKIHDADEHINPTEEMLTESQVDENESSVDDLLTWLYGYESDVSSSLGLRDGRRIFAEEGMGLLPSIDDNEIIGGAGSITNSKRHELIANAVVEIYKAMTEDDENFRFDLILDQDEPDLSFLHHICPQECEACSESTTEVVCRVCCPELFTEPISVIKLSTQSTQSEILYNFLAEVAESTGHTPVSSSLLQNSGRLGHGMARGEIKAMIRRFKWLQRGNTIDESQDFSRVWDEDYQVNSMQVCGFYEDAALLRPEGRIMGGTEVLGTRQYPWQMSLATSRRGGMFYQHRCGASLLAEKWVLTAAHCVFALRRRRRRRKLYVMGGFLHMNERETAQIFDIEAYIIHERFVPRLYEQDIALLRLATPAVYSPSLLPVCLPQPTHYRRRERDEANIGRRATLTGWGRKWNRGPLSRQLEMVELPIISNRMCMDWYNSSGSRQFIPASTFLCAGFPEGKMDACSGDSGGPLIVPRSDGRAEVLGVVSWGIGCGVAGRPGVYSRVSQFVPWIKRKMMEYEERD